MSPRPAPVALSSQGRFTDVLTRMASQPLHELCPAGPGAETAALGFSLALAAAWTGAPGLIWAGEEGVFAEDGAPYPVGLAQYGVDPAKLIVVRAAKRDDALWAAEQALSARGAVVICALSGRGKPLDLKTTRRLLLFAEKNGSRCLLVRPLAEASAAWTRWRVAYAPSNAAPDELGTPAFAIELMRARAGPSGARFILEWNADARSFAERDLARHLFAAPEYGQVDPIRARA
jgi:protein ImuA